MPRELRCNQGEPLMRCPASDPDAVIYVSNMIRGLNSALAKHAECHEKGVAEQAVSYLQCGIHPWQDPF